MGLADMLNLGSLVGDLAGAGVERMLSDIPMAPETRALSKFIRELYGEGGVFLDDAEERVAELIEEIESDEEQRRLLLEKRAEFCNAQDKYRLLAELFEEAAETLEGGHEALAASLASVMKVLLAQCTPAWGELSAKARARILAPLYMALHHLEAYKDTSKSYHVEAAETLALLALARLDETVRVDDQRNPGHAPLHRRP